MSLLTKENRKNDGNGSRDAFLKLLYEATNDNIILLYSILEV